MEAAATSAAGNIGQKSSSLEYCCCCPLRYHHCYRKMVFRLDRIGRDQFNQEAAAIAQAKLNQLNLFYSMLLKWSF